MASCPIEAPAFRACLITGSAVFVTFYCAVPALQVVFFAALRSLVLRIALPLIMSGVF